MDRCLKEMEDIQLMMQIYIFFSYGTVTGMTWDSIFPFPCLLTPKVMGGVGHSLSYEDLSHGLGMKQELFGGIHGLGEAVLIMASLSPEELPDL